MLPSRAIHSSRLWSSPSLTSRSGSSDWRYRPNAMRSRPGIGREVDRAARLVVGVRAVEPNVVARARQRQVDAIGPRLGAAVAVEEVVEAPLPRRHQLEEQLARPRRGLGDALVERGQQRLHPVAGAELAQPRLGQVAGGHHGAGVALHQVGQPRVAEEDPVRLLVELPLADDPHRGHEHALVVDLGGVRRDRAGPQPADVLVVAEGGGEGHRATRVEDRHREDHVLVVLHGAVRDVRVVEPVDVARPHGLERVELQDGLQHAGPAARDVAGHDAAPRVEDADEVVLLLLDEGRHRAALHQELHVADRGGEAAADDLERDRIDARRGRTQAWERSRRMLCASSTRARKPGATSGVASSCSMMAGPSKHHARRQAAPRVAGRGDEARAAEVDRAVAGDRGGQRAPARHRAACARRAAACPPR